MFMSSVQKLKKNTKPQTKKPYPIYHVKIPSNKVGCYAIRQRSEQFIARMQALLRHLRAGETVRLRAARTACKIMNRDYLTIPTCSLKPLSIITRSEGLFFSGAADTYFNDITSSVLLPIAG